MEMESRILIEVPAEFETERLLLRAPRPGDGKEVNDAIRESFDRLQRWFHWAQKLPTPEETEINLREAYSRFVLRDTLRYLVFLKDTRTFIGSAGFHGIDWSIPKMEIGYWLREGYEGKGYMTEAVEGHTRFAMEQLGVKRLQIRCDHDNDRSRLVAERAGYKLEGRLAMDGKNPQGELRDTLIFGKTI